MKRHDRKVDAISKCLRIALVAFDQKADVVVPRGFGLVAYSDSE